MLKETIMLVATDHCLLDSCNIYHLSFLRFHYTVFTKLYQNSLSPPTSFVLILQSQRSIYIRLGVAKMSYVKWRMLGMLDVPPIQSNLGWIILLAHICGDISRSIEAYKQNLMVNNMKCCCPIRGLIITSVEWWRLFLTNWGLGDFQLCYTVNSSGKLIKV